MFERWLAARAEKRRREAEARAELVRRKAAAWTKLESMVRAGTRISLRGVDGGFLFEFSKGTEACRMNIPGPLENFGEKLQISVDRGLIPEWVLSTNEQPEELKPGSEAEHAAALDLLAHAVRGRLGFLAELRYDRSSDTFTVSKHVSEKTGFTLAEALHQIRIISFGV